jgi:N-ethylmaleimide reductase
LVSGTFLADAERSVIRWTGRNPFNHHSGTVMLADGEMVIRDNTLVSARFRIDMNRIACEDIPDPGINRMLIDHLRSSDFFDVANHPIAEFVAESITPITGATEGTPNHVLCGRFTLRGITRVIEFPILAAMADSRRFTAQGTLDLDRTRFGSHYGSGKLFRFLGKHLVNDHIHLHVKLHAGLQEPPSDPQPHEHAMNLLSPLRLGSLHLKNRVLLAPMTRCRATLDHVPTPLMADYYSQRASGGLLIAEATAIADGASAFFTEPGIYSEAQVAGWKAVTDAVQAKGGLIFLQLWHGGRACHSELNGGKIPVAPSALPITNDMAHTPQGSVPYDVPRELRDDELPGIVAQFEKAAENAKAAGFDGVEVHGANGYLLDTFLRDGSNLRGGRYGGSIENRARLMLEALDAVIRVWGADRVGLRISPLNSYNSMRDSDPIALTTYIAQQCSARGLAYLHLMRGDFLGEQGGDVVTPAREHFNAVLIGNMGYSADEAEQAIGEGRLDAVAFGTSFLANPDLPARIAAKAALNAPDSKKFYSPGPEGYTDYPAMAEMPAS